MDFFNVALLQMNSEKTQNKNLEKGVEYCRKAKTMGADIALFPEMWNNGYTVTDNCAEMMNSAVETNGPFVAAFKNLAKELNMAIGITYLEKYEPQPKNTLSIFDRFGNHVLTYSKVHTCDFSVERNLTPGDDFYTSRLNTEKGDVKIGAMICYDREFPESARILMLKGAEIILVPNACPMEINRLSQLRSRAYENMTGIATANYAGGHNDCNGHSSAFDGIAYDDNGSRDMLVVQAGEEEGVYLAPFPIEKIRSYRKNEVHGNAYRRPSKYHALVCETIEEPFVRPDYRK